MKVDTYFSDNIGLIFIKSAHVAVSTLVSRFIDLLTFLLEDNTAADNSVICITWNGKYVVTGNRALLVADAIMTKSTKQLAGLLLMRRELHNSFGGSLLEVSHFRRVVSKLHILYKFLVWFDVSLAIALKIEGFKLFWCTSCRTLFEMKILTSKSRQRSPIKYLRLLPQFAKAWNLTRSQCSLKVYEVTSRLKNPPSISSWSSNLKAFFHLYIGGRCVQWHIPETSTKKWHRNSASQYV